MDEPDTERKQKGHPEKDDIPSVELIEPQGERAVGGGHKADRLDQEPLLHIRSDSAHTGHGGGEPGHRAVIGGKSPESGPVGPGLPGDQGGVDTVHAAERDTVHRDGSVLYLKDRGHDRTLESQGQVIGLTQIPAFPRVTPEEGLPDGDLTAELRERQGSPLPQAVKLVALGADILDMDHGQASGKVGGEGQDPGTVIIPGVGETHDRRRSPEIIFGEGHHGAVVHIPVIREGDLAVASREHRGDIAHVLHEDGRDGRVALGRGLGSHRGRDEGTSREIPAPGEPAPLGDITADHPRSADTHPVAGRGAVAGDETHARALGDTGEDLIHPRLEKGVIGVGLLLGLEGELHALHRLDDPAAALVR